MNVDGETMWWVRIPFVIRTLIIAGGLVACVSDDDAVNESGDGSPAQEAAPDPAGAAQAGPCGITAPDEATAEVMARVCGGSVEVESARSEYTEVYVEPSGSRTLVAALVPQRARRQDGTWSPIDTTLRRTGDQLVPAATVADVRFSAGGAGPFVTVTRERHTFTLSWPSPLPEPTVAGDSATYADVLPDVDLVVTATATGFMHLLVVKTQRAAANPAVRHASYRLGGDATLSSTPEGALIAEAQGVRVVTAEAPVMWDTTTRSTARMKIAPGARDEQARVARVEAEISAGHVVLSPDAAMLDDPAAKFPLVIDPPYTIGQNQFTYASADNQNGPANDTTVAPGDPSPAAAELRVGNDPASTHQVRSFMRFPLGITSGKQVITAKIAGRVDHTWKCGSNRPTYFFRSAAIAATPRQAWPGPALQLLLGNTNLHANETSCGEPNVPFELSTTALINDLRSFASSGATSYTVAISAGENTSGLNETNTERWMRYFLGDFKLHITYNTKPNKPDSLTVDGKPCVAGANRPFIKTTTPTLRAHVTDPDAADALDVWFAWAKWNGSAFVDEPGGGKQDSVPNGGTAVFNVTGNVDGGIYTFRSQSDDSPNHNPFLPSDVTNLPGNCEWEVDISPPAIPTVTSDVYLEGAGGCPGGACGSVGQTGHFTFSSSSDTKSFLWGWTDPPTAPLVPSTLGGSVSIDFTPTSSGPRTLFVRAIDRAGNESNKVYQFYVAPESPALARWLLGDPSGTTELADDTGNGNPLAPGNGVLGAPGRIVPGADGIPRSAIQFDGSVGGATTAGPVIADTSKSFSVAAWVKMSDSAVTHRVLDQVGGTSSAFLLEYEKTANVWKFTAPAQDGSAFPGATSTSAPRLNTWTHLVGTYDSAARELRLYVNGALERTAGGITTWRAGGSTRIGYSWAGALAEIQLWNRVVSAAEVFALSDPIAVGRVGEWHMDEVGPGPAFDASGMAHDLTFFNGALIPPSGAGKIGTGLRLDGVDDYAAADAQVLHTDQSFTVSAWARPTTIAVDQTFVSQQSTGSHAPFSLYFGHESGGVWKFRMHASPTDTVNVTYAVAPAVNVTTAFHHLVGVFDAQKLEMRLYIDGTLKATSPMSSLWQPWDATGPLLIGRHHSGAAGTEFTAGDLDEVRVYQGVVADVTRIP